MSLVYLKENRTFSLVQTDFLTFEPMSTSTVYSHSRLCYFGLAKPAWSSGIPQGDGQKVKGTIRKETGCPSLCPQPSSQCTKTDRRHSICGELASWFYSVLEMKISACVFFGGFEENHTNFLKGAFLGKRGSLGPTPRLRTVPPHTGLLPWIWSACLGKGQLHQHRKHSERWLSSREARPGPGYMASEPGGSLKSLAADTSLLMCLSSVMPAS